MRQIALTAIGEDKPGIVAAVCRVLYETGGNLRDTSMTILSGEFAMILVVAVPRSLDVEELSRRFDPVRTQVGIAVFLRELPDTADAAAGPGSPADAYLVRVMGADRPGIVFRVAEEMTRRRVNITDVETRVTGEDGTPVYVMLMEVAPPPGTDMGELESELARLSTELAVEISIRQIEYTAL